MAPDDSLMSLADSGQSVDRLDLASVLAVFDPDIRSRSLKLARHADQRVDLDTIVRTGFMDAYESMQARPVFHDCDLLLRFMGEANGRARFAGCSRVLGHREGPPDCPPGFPYPEIWTGRWSYDLEPVTVFDDLRDRLVVDWGRSTRSWVQRGLAKLVVEVRPRNFGADFPGYEDVVLSYADLQRIVAAPDANRIWHRVLAAVSGVYLIVDLQSGNQYVGSAYGDRGILGRWESYARTGHGDNARLRALLDEHPRGAESFQFSILRVLPRSMPSRDVVAIESAFKRKLGSRAFGLNAN